MDCDGRWEAAVEDRVVAVWFAWRSWRATMGISSNDAGKTKKKRRARDHQAEQ